MTKGKKTSPLVELAVNAKFEEERLRHTKELNLRVQGLPKPSDPLKARLNFLHKKLDLKNILVEKVWTAQDDSLVIRFHSAAECLQALRAKKKLFSLPTKIYLNADLTCIHVELWKAHTLVAATREDNKWVVIRDCRAFIRDTPPLGWSRPGPSQ